MNPAKRMQRVAELTGMPCWRSRRNVPIVSKGQRNVCYFGKSQAFALFDRGNRVGFVTSGVRAASWLLQV